MKAVLCLLALAVVALAEDIDVTELEADTYHPVKINRCTCYEKGNYYSPKSANACGSFFQWTAWIAPVEQRCPTGLQFDVDVCVCNWPRDTTCPSRCQPDDPTPPPPADSCESHGNIYAPVPGTNCRRFTQRTAVLPPVTHKCPRGLQFDTNVCVCNWPRDTVCRV